ncbi:DegQ family serine endoprotease [Algihabitans albus]|uniref:DegQ family serine endoprotease n=1 Tax=Algihabitans albus TaxID=2164067 RepID=UPI000E5D7D1A|nr:DegQ family serine endoprotease [Algihabitans albus]
MIFSRGRRIRGRRWGAVAIVLAALLPLTAAAQQRVVPESREEMQLSFAPVVKEVAPAVVNIFASKTVVQRQSPMLDDPFFRRFFGEDFGVFGQPRERNQNSLGSGVIVDSSGLVVTNHHVIADADEIRVVLADRREFEAEILLEDPRTDISILRLESDALDLPVATFRDSDSIEVGDLVLAIGNPFGVGQTVTSGIVSATARTQVGVTDYSFFIQTDAAINPGNSGGALVTLDGGLIGINTAIYSRSGGSIGIGFAVPSNMVATVVAGAREGGVVRRPWAGAQGQTVTADLAQAVGLSRAVGVMVGEIYPGGPADRAGLAEGDVVLAVGGQPVADTQSLRYRLATQRLGAQTELQVWRAGSEVVIDLPLEVAPETPPRNPARLSGRHPLSGAVVANLSPALADELDLQGTWQGVVVLQVPRGSPARRSGFRRGDVLHEVNRQAVRTVSQLGVAIEAAEGRWQMRVEREGRVRSVDFSG